MRRKTEPTPRQSVALTAQRARGGELRGWWELKQRAADQLRTPIAKRLLKRTATEPATSRGVDRVPARYQGEDRPTDWLVHYSGPNRAERRAGLLRGRRQQAGHLVAGVDDQHAEQMVKVEGWRRRADEVLDQPDVDEARRDEAADQLTMSDREARRLERLRRLERAAAKRTSRTKNLVARPSTNLTHTNPMRDVRSLRSGRLRKELRP